MPTIRISIILCRHNRPIFWLLEYIIRFANRPLFRFCFGWMMPPKHSVLNVVKKVIPSERINHFVLQVFEHRLIFLI